MLPYTFLDCKRSWSRPLEEYPLCPDNSRFLNSWKVLSKILSDLEREVHWDAQCFKMAAEGFEPPTRGL